MMRSYEVITPAIIPNFDLVTYLLGAWFGFRIFFWDLENQNAF